MNLKRGRCKGAFGCHWARIRAVGAIVLEGQTALCRRCERRQRDSDRAARNVRAKRAAQRRVA